MITAAASAVHGSGRFWARWYIAAVNAAIYGLLFGLALGWWGLLVIPTVLGWWATLRTGRQAQVELQCMDRINPPHPGYLSVLKAHYYTGFLTILGLWLFNYDSPLGKRLGWNHGRFWDCRRPTEFLSGLTLDVMLFLFFFSWG